MRSTRVAGAIIGVVFGAVLSWSGMTSPDVIREGLLFESAYLFLFFGAAVSTAFAGLWILRRRAPRALLTGERVQWTTVKHPDHRRTRPRDHPLPADAGTRARPPALPSPLAADATA